MIKTISKIGNFQGIISDSAPHQLARLKPSFYPIKKPSRATLAWWIAQTPLLKIPDATPKVRGDAG